VDIYVNSTTKPEEEKGTARRPPIRSRESTGKNRI
jgi:hypothetical protein